MGSHSLLQGISWTQVSNPGFLRCRQILYHLIDQGNLFLGYIVKNPPASAGDAGDTGSIPWGRSSGGGHGNPLQCSCLENPMDRGSWQVPVQGVAKSLSNCVTQHACTGVHTINTASSLWMLNSTTWLRLRLPGLSAIKVLFPPFHLVLSGRKSLCDLL